MRSKDIARSTFLKRVHDTIKHYNLLDKGDKVLVAVSGGPDSVCLLEALNALRRKLGIELFIANMDHGIRSAESRRDSDFVKALAEELGLEIAHKKVRLKTAKRGKKSMEELAREKRYDFLRKAAAGFTCNVIATGHTMDDQSETVIMRMLKGSSFSALSGIPPVRYEGDLKIVRPLIRTEKKDIFRYLKRGGADFVTDSTNLDRRILRNSVRMDIIPFLEQYNPKVRRALTNLADSVREDAGFLDEAKAGVSLGGTVIDAADLILQPRALRKEVFKKAVTSAGGSIKRLTYRHWMEMDSLLRSGVTGKSIDLPGDIRITKEKRQFILEKRKKS